MKFPILAFFAFALFSQNESIAFGLYRDNVPREGDEVRFSQPVVFVNPSKYSERLVYIYGRVGRESDASSYLYRCFLAAIVPANSKATIQAGRKMVVTSSPDPIELENGVSISCESKRDEKEVEWYDANPAPLTSTAEIMRSLPILKITRKAPPAPNDRDL